MSSSLDSCPFGKWLEQKINKNRAVTQVAPSLGSAPWTIHPGSHYLVLAASGQHWQVVAAKWTSLVENLVWTLARQLPESCSISGDDCEFTQKGEHEVSPMMSLSNTYETPQGPTSEYLGGIWGGMRTAKVSIRAREMRTCICSCGSLLTCRLAGLGKMDDISKRPEVGKQLVTLPRGSIP